MSEEITQKHTFWKLVNLLPPMPSDISDPKKAYELYMKADEYSDFLDDYKKMMREKMFELAEQLGEEDDKGSHKLRFEDGTGFKKEARHYVSIDDDRALELAEEKGINISDKELKAKGQYVEELIEVIEEQLPDLADLVDIKEKINEDYLEEAYLNGDITEQEFSELVNKEIRYALRKYK